MPDKLWIVDASVLGAAFFEETHSAAARAFIRDAQDLTAPSLLVLEIASIAAKKVWKGLSAADVGARAVRETPRLVFLDDTLGDLAPAAFRLAAEHRVSAYDATYLALAQIKGSKVVTLDEKLKARADACQLGSLVILLTDALADG